MKNPRCQFLHWPKLLLPALGWIFSALLASAQTPTGTVQGRVYNPATAQYVRNAEVRIEGSNIVDETESDGSFSLHNVPAGTVTLTVSYTGYETAREVVTVTAGQTATREINLAAIGAAAPAKSGSGEVLQLAAFTVSSDREGNAKAIAEQRRNMNIVTSVASDVFGDVTDGNVGEFLKFLPGVDVDYVESETRGPRLGGMDAQYTAVSFDGVRLASADANRTGDLGRATSFEAFSISSIESIEIHRTTSSDMDADAPAGTINMKTRRAFDRKGRRISYNFSLNLNSEEFTLSRTYGPSSNKEWKARPNFSLEYSDVFLGNRLGAVLSINHVDSYTEQYRHNMTYNSTPETTLPSGAAAPIDTRPMVLTALNFKDGAKNIAKDTISFTTDLKATPRLVLSNTYIYNYALGQFYNREFTFNAATNNANINTGRRTVQGDGVNHIRANSTASNSALGGGSASKRTHTVSLAPKFEYKLNALTVDGALTWSRSRNNYEALEKGHTRSDDVNNITSGFTADRSGPTSYEWTIQQTSGADWFDLNNRTNPRLTNEGRYASTELWTGELNARWVTPLERFPTSLKFGGKWAEDTRHNGNETPYYSWQYIGPGGGTTGSWAFLGASPNVWDTGTTNILTVKNTAGTVGFIPRPNSNKIADLFNAHPELFVNNANADAYFNSFIANRRDVVQTVTASYGMADIRLSKSIAVRTGIRWERTENDSIEFDPRTKAEMLASGYALNTSGRATTVAGYQYQYMSKPRVTRHSQYDDFFPMISVKYSITPELQFHTGFNKAIARPPIDSLTGAWIINEDAHLVTSPNPNLLPEYSKNFAARLSYFLNKTSGQVSVGISQNTIRNLRETRRGTPEEFGVGDDPFYAGYEFNSPFNVASPRRFRNLELAYNQTLPFKQELLRGITVNVAYTRSYADARRGGLLPHRFTSSLGYSYRKLKLRAGLVWRDNTDDGSATTDYGRYRRHDAKLDLGGEYSINRYVSLFFQGRNIFNGGQTWMQTPPGNVQGQGAAIRVYENYGSNWNFGVKGTF
jgi:TonB-dependent receptor